MENEINIFCKMLKQILCKHIFDSSFNNAPRIRKIVYNKKVCSDTLDYTYHLLSTKIPKREKDTHR